MTRIHNIAVAATLAITGIVSAQAAETQWGNRSMPMRHSQVTQCTLLVERVYQPNQGQPIHLVVKNISQLRLQYTINVRVVRDRKEEFRGAIVVDNANAGEVSDRPTRNAYAGTLSGAQVMLELASCALRN